MDLAATVAHFESGDDATTRGAGIFTGKARLIRCLAPANTALEEASRVSVASLAVIWIVIVGLADYWTGPEMSMLIFYLIPVTLGTWYFNLKFGVLLALFSIATSSISDLACGVPRIGFWNESVGLASYLVFVILLSRWRAALDLLDERVRSRTAALQQEIHERVRLQKEMSEVTERERRRLGHDLHDSLCQHLTGTALAAQILSAKLATDSRLEAGQAEKVVALIEEGIDLTRNLARGFFSPDIEGIGLVAALEGLAQSVKDRFHFECEFQHELPEEFALESAYSTQLYRIAQEAVTNAAKHARASRIIIELDQEAETLTLNVFDDGTGFDRAACTAGLGVRMMEQGAQSIGASLSISAHGRHGTVVSCRLTSERP